MPVTSKPAQSGAASRSETADLITVRDILLLAAIPVLGLIAWLVPERHWSRVVAAIARAVIPLLRLLYPGAFDRMQLATTGKIEMQPATDIYLRWFAGRLEQELQYLREYRPGGWKPEFTIVGREHLDRAVAGDRGGILWVAPMLYSSLVAHKALHEAGFQVSALSREYHGPSDTRFGRNFINRIAINCENRYRAQRFVMQSGRESSALRQLVRTLRDQQLVSITCSYYGRKIVAAPLLGGTLPIAIGAANLAITTGAPLLPVFAVRKGWRQFEVIIAKPMQLPTLGSRDDVISQVVCRYAMLVEQYANRDPGAFADWPWLDFS